MPLSLCTCIEPKKKPKVIWSSEGLEQETVIWLALLCHCPPSHKSLKSEPWATCLAHLYNPSPMPSMEVAQMFYGIVDFQEQRKERKKEQPKAKQTGEKYCNYSCCCCHINSSREAAL